MQKFGRFHVDNSAARRRCSRSGQTTQASAWAGPIDRIQTSTPPRLAHFISLTPSECPRPTGFASAAGRGVLPPTTRPAVRISLPASGLLQKTRDALSVLATSRPAAIFSYEIRLKVRRWGLRPSGRDAGAAEAPRRLFRQPQGTQRNRQSSIAN